VRINLFNLYTPAAGNAAVPEKLRIKSAPITAGVVPKPQIRRFSRPVIVAAIAILISTTVAGVLWETGHLPGTHSVALARVPVVGIVPFTNQTGDVNLAWLGDGFAHILSDSLAQSRHVQIASPDRVKHLMEGASASTDLTHKAQQTGLNYLVSGEVLGSGDSYMVSARVIDTGTAHETASKLVSGLSRQNLLGAIQDISTSVRKGLGLPLAESVDTYAADL
jgi:TolB-like protein